jgi:hypothetical protein
VSNHDRRQTDPYGYLETPARIIAENDKYAVVAVRVEKEWLRSNIGFLAALADAADGSG